MSGFNVILPTLIKELSIPQSTAVWPASAFALVSAAFFLPSGVLQICTVDTQSISLAWSGLQSGLSLGVSLKTT